MMEKTFIINSVDELSQVSDLLISWRDKSDIIAFYGPMGQGRPPHQKLVPQAWRDRRGHSPTFALVNEYPTPVEGSIFHFDFYRIKKLEEVYDIGYEDYFYSGRLCLLEWPELIDPLMPDHFIKVEIALGDTDNARKIKCTVL